MSRSERKWTRAIKAMIVVVQRRKAARVTVEDTPRRPRLESRRKVRGSKHKATRKDRRS